MSPKLGEVLLIDDHDADNHLHETLLQEMDVATKITTVANGQQALRYLTTLQDGHFPRPELILLDINMPVMNGWEFLAAYDGLDVKAQGDVVLMMVTTSLNPDDMHSAQCNANVDDFVTKTLSPETLGLLLRKHFPARFQPTTRRSHKFHLPMSMLLKDARQGRRQCTYY